MFQNALQSLSQTPFTTAFCLFIYLFPEFMMQPYNSKSREHNTIYAYMDTKERICRHLHSTNKIKQDAWLSQRDRAAGCVIVFAKSRRLELGVNILRTL